MKTPTPEGMFAIAVVLVVFGAGCLLFFAQTMMLGMFLLGSGIFILMSVPSIHHYIAKRFLEEDEDGT